MFNKVTFVPGSKYYKKLMSLFFNDLIIELDKNNIIYEYSEYCQDNSINIISHLEKSYLESVNFGKGLSLILVHGMSSKGYPKWEQCKYCIDNADFFIAPSIDYLNDYLEVGVDENKVKLCGNLKVDYLFKLKDNIQILENTICYTPNHNNNTGLLTSYPDFLNDINVLKTCHDVIVSPHPYNNNNIPTDENLCKSEVVISDVGSTSYEAMLLNKPVIFLDYISKNYVLNKFPNSLESKIFTENIGYHIKNKDDILNITEKALKNGVKENQKEFIEKLYPSNLIGKSAKLITEQIKKMLR